IIHLGGEPITGTRWTQEKKRQIYESRIHSTKLIVEKITRIHHPPKIFMSASAIGYYGDRGDELLTEESMAGSGFLAQTAYDWEQVTKPASQCGIRVVNLRFGVVLSRVGGALPSMLVPFKLGLGGKLGNGKQYMSWITIDDVINIIYELILNNNLSGPVNIVSPNPVTNSDFTKTLGKILNRPTIVGVPSFIIRLLFGEMGKSIFLSSLRVYPEKLLSYGYKFLYPDLECALKHVLGIQ
ncbi:MAG: TIGR01777 family oxidoreductase, partial [Planctomycetota bacterium]